MSGSVKGATALSAIASRTHTSSTKMDKDLDSGRRKKSDKAKDKQARNGSFSQKHVRIQEEQAARAKQRNACVKAEASCLTGRAA